MNLGVPARVGISDFEPDKLMPVGSTDKLENIP